MSRRSTLSNLLAHTQAAITARVASDTAAASAMQRVAAALAMPAQQRSSPAPAPGLVPACGFLDPAIDELKQRTLNLSPLADALRDLAPELAWRQRASDDPVFTQGHASASVVGAEPHALEQRPDVRIGISLMAPGVTYPDHRHPPEEVYIVLSEGEWRENSGPWHTPGIGGIVYNPHDIVHAMRSSGRGPLLAIWCLPVDAPTAG